MAHPLMVAVRLERAGLRLEQDIADNQLDLITILEIGEALKAYYEIVFNVPLPPAEEIELNAGNISSGSMLYRMQAAIYLVLYARRTIYIHHCTQILTLVHELLADYFRAG